MRPGFGPVFPGVRRGVAAHMVLAPVAQVVASGVVGAQGGGVIKALVAKHAAKGLQAVAVAHQLVPVEVARFVAQVADEGAVGLAQRHTPLCALAVVGFCHIEGDGAAVVAREDGRPTRPVGQKLEHRPGPARRGLQPQACEGVEKLALGRFNLLPAAQVGGLGEVGQHPRLAARCAQRRKIVGWHGKVAGVVGGAVAAHAIEPAAVVGTAAVSHPAPQVRPVLRCRGQRRHGEQVGHKGERAAAVQALHAVKKNQMTAMVAIEYPHGGAA